MKEKKGLLILSLLIMVMLFSCSNCGGTTSISDNKSDKKEVSSTKQKVSTEKTKTESKSGESLDQPMDVLYDFASKIQEAHVRSSGLLINFGVSGRNKYTLGDWRTGWRGNFIFEGNTFSYTSLNIARLFVSLNENEKGPGTIILKAKGPSKKARVHLFLNDKKLGTHDFSGTDFTHATFKVEELRSGDNEILIRVDSSERGLDGGRARLAVDYLRIISENTETQNAASDANSLVESSNSNEQKELVLSKGESLQWNLPIPTDAVLTASVSDKEAAGINIVLDSGETIEAKPDSRGEIRVSLQKYFSQMAQFEFYSLKNGVRFNSAQLQMIPKQRTPAPGIMQAQNIVLILIDTLRADRFTVYNPDTRVQTEFSDELSKESMIFDRAYVQENWTKPSIASLLTGLYPASHQTKTDKNVLPSSAVMMSEHFRKMGFNTAGFVANGYVSNKFGFQRGWNTWTNYVREGKRNRAQFVSDDAVAWLKNRNKSEPFFLYVHTIDPHVPYLPPRKYYQLYDPEPYNGIVNPSQTAHLLGRIKTGAAKLNDRDKFRLEALYDGEVTYHDEQYAKIYEELKNQDLLKNTVFVVTSDHGEEFFEHGSVGHGHSLYEEMIHVPLLVRLPKASPSQQLTRYENPVEQLSLFATFCEMTGIICPEDIHEQSLSPQLKGNRTPAYPNTAFTEFMEGQLSAISLRYKLIYRGFSTTLFDLHEDPKETKDQSDQNQLALWGMRDALGMHMGQFVPVREWKKAEASAKSPAKTTSKPSRKIHKKEETQIDEETKKQLQALGYMLD